MAARILQESTRQRRQRRIRARVHGTTSRPRLVVFRSSRYLSAQIIDDQRQVTLVAASDYEKDRLSGTKVDHAARIGTTLAKRAKEQHITTVVFDRGGYRYHGRVKAFAEAARAAGLNF